MTPNRPPGSHRQVLVLCEPHDASALWATAGLEQRTDRVDIVTSPMFATARRWEHRIRGDVAEFEVTLADGRRISSNDPWPVLNRLSFVPGHHFATVEGDDRDYALQEFHALFLSWLTAYSGRMLNRPSPRFLGGHWRHPAAWAILAARAGLRVPPYRSTDGPSVPLERCETVFVVEGQVVAPSTVEAPALEACRRLAELSGDGLVGVELAPQEQGKCEFVSATPMPDLAKGGERLLDVLASVLLPVP